MCKCSDAGCRQCNPLGIMATPLAGQPSLGLLTPSGGFLNTVDWADADEVIVPQCDLENVEYCESCQ